ncbi:MAG: DUF6268 family outer membrane beta-barrel protein [Phycisphaerales bacterium]
MPTKTPTPLMIIALTAAPLLAGQPEENPQGQEGAEQVRQAQESRLTISPYVSGSFHADADFDSDIGEFGFSEYRAGLRISNRVGDRGVLSANIGFGLLDYDITPSGASVANDAADIGAGLDDVYEGEIFLSYAHRGEGKLSYLLGAGVISAGEDGADFGDTLDFLGTAGFQYQYNEQLSLGLGVLIKTRQEDDVLVIPAPQIRYQINERWTLASERAGLALSYKASDQLTYGIAGEYVSTNFRLNDTHAAIVSEGVANHRRVPVSIFADYTPNEQIEINARIGASLAGNIEFLNSSGTEITDQDIDTAIFGSLNVSFRF